MNRHLLPDEIDLLLDGEVGFGVAPLRAHVRGCSDCAAELEATRLVVAELERLPHLAPAPLFADRVMQQVQVFEPWHVALLDALRRLVPQSRPARALAGAGALSVASLLTIAMLWIGARLDVLTLLGGAAFERTGTSLRSALGEAIGSALGGPAAGLGLALLATTFLIALVVAAAGVRAATAASRRRRG